MSTGCESLFETNFNMDSDQQDIPIIDADDDDNAFYKQAKLTIRSLVSWKEAGIIIGTGGRTVVDIRNQTNARVGVSKPTPPPTKIDRVLTVSGQLESVAKAYGMVATALLEASSPDSLPPPSTSSIGMKLLISDNQMGPIIGRQGGKIKAIQDCAGVKMTAFKELLPQSTERIVQVEASSSQSIQRAIWEIGKCLVDEMDRAAGTILYNPSKGGVSNSNVGQHHRSVNRAISSSNTSGGGEGLRPNPGEGEVVQNISIPADMVGCVIGRQGSKIQEIRSESQARISISKLTNDNDERMFTIVGTPESNDRALYLLFEQLEAEKARREQQQQQLTDGIDQN